MLWLIGKLNLLHFFPDCICPANLQVNCGSDGVTYPNHCQRECEGADFVHEGPCAGDGKIRFFTPFPPFFGQHNIWKEGSFCVHGVEKSTLPHSMVSSQIRVECFNSIADATATLLELGMRV